MPRKRTIKPGFFTNERLAGECSPLARLLFAGLWCWADREGRIEDRPRRLRAEILPYDLVEGEALVAELAERGFIERYEIDGVRLLQIVNFEEHQDPHPRETPSELPPPPRSSEGEPKANLGVAQAMQRSPSPSRPSRSSEEAFSPAGARAQGAADREALDERIATPNHDALVAALRAGGVDAGPAEKLRRRKELDAAVREVGLSVAVARVTSCWVATRSSVSWYLDAIVPPRARDRPPSSSPQVGVAAPAPAAAFGEGGRRGIER